MTIDTPQILDIGPQFLYPSVSEDNFVSHSPKLQHPYSLMSITTILH